MKYSCTVFAVCCLLLGACNGPDPQKLEQPQNGGVAASPTGVVSVPKSQCPPGLNEDTTSVGQVDCAGKVNGDLLYKEGSISAMCIPKGGFTIKCVVPDDVCKPGGIKRVTENGVECNNTTPPPNATPPKAKAAKPPATKVKLAAKVSGGDGSVNMSGGNGSVNVNGDGNSVNSNNGNTTTIVTPPKTTSCDIKDCGVANKTNCSIVCTEPQKATCSCDCTNRVFGACTELKERCGCQ